MGNTFRKPIRLNQRRLVVLKKIGEGGFSVVYLVRDQASKELYALKKIPLLMEDQIGELEHEFACHKLVNHPNVLKLIDAAIVPSKKSRTRRQGILLLPFFEHGTVQGKIDKCKVTGESFGVPAALKIVLSACHGLTAFHSLNPPMAVRDLKPGNILISQDGGGVLMDLGSVGPARIEVKDRKQAMEVQDECAQKCTAPYRAPELHDVASNCVISEKIDVWSLGCTLYAMLYGDSPFDGTATSTMSGQLRFPAAKDAADSQAQDLIKFILKVDPDARPSVAAVEAKIAELKLA